MDDTQAANIARVLEQRLRLKITIPEKYPFTVPEARHLLLLRLLFLDRRIGGAGDMPWS